MARAVPNHPWVNMTWPNASPGDTAMPLTGSVTPTGANWQQKVTGTIYYIAAAGAVTIAGALTKVPGKLLTGLLTPAGNAARTQVSKILTASLTPAGALTRIFIPVFGSIYYVTMTGAVTISGALSRVGAYIRVMTGAIRPTGYLDNGVTQYLTAPFKAVVTTAYMMASVSMRYTKAEVGKRFTKAVHRD